MGSYLSLPILVLAAILQATLIPQIRIEGGGPDLVFLLVLAWAIKSSLDEAVVWAFVGGIAQDSMSAAPLGTSILGMIVIVFVVNIIGRQIYNVSLPLIAIFTLFGSIFQQTVIVIIIIIAGFEVRLTDNFSYVIVPTIIYNLVLIWPVYWLVRRIQRRVHARRRIFT
ncbi:MAG: rod shape-determining protein MreD [Chloroflexi bacterium]|nr:MAG: rod shape-determining protein MreD [Chloroflexota bacterium]